MSVRTRDGLAAARARGRTGGQKAKLTPRQAKIAQDMYEELGPVGRRTQTVAEITADFGVSRPTIYRYLQLNGGMKKADRSQPSSSSSSSVASTYCRACSPPPNSGSETCRVRCGADDEGGQWATTGGSPAVDAAFDASGRCYLPCRLPLPWAGDGRWVTARLPSNLTGLRPAKRY